jgi:hypothetical protein
MKTLLALTFAGSAVIPSAPFEDHTGPYGAGITVGSNHVRFANGATIYLCGDTSDGTIAFALDALAKGSNAIVIPKESEGL